MHPLGVTLIETLLVLIIVGVLSLFGLQTYQQLRTERQLKQVEYNVDVLFQGLRSYYFAHCIANRDYATGKVINEETGQLDPTVKDQPKESPMVKIINIEKDITKPGYLTDWPPAYTPFFITDYKAQFNLYDKSVRNVNFCVKGQCDSLPTKAKKNVYLWTIQVAIKVNDPKLATYYKGRLGANCVSELKDDGVVPCSEHASNSEVSGDYIIFERLPSMALSVSNSSPLWISMPLLKDFIRQYTNDDNYAVTIDDPNYNNKTGYQNYLCGG